MTRPILTLSTLLAVFLGLAACETVEGFGRDVESAGEGISQSSNEVQSGL